MPYMNYQLQFLEKLKNFFELRNQQWSGDVSLKKKN